MRSSQFIFILNSTAFICKHHSWHFFFFCPIYLRTNTCKCTEWINPCGVHRGCQKHQSCLFLAAVLYCSIWGNSESCCFCLYQNHQEFIYLTLRMTPFFLGDWVPMRSSVGPTPDGLSKAPWSITQQAATFSERGRELVTSLSPPAWMSNPFFSSCVPFLWSSSSPELLVYWNNWAAFSATRLPVQLFELRYQVWCCDFPLTFLSELLPPPLPASLWGRDGSPSWLQPLGTMTRHPWYIIYSGSAGLELCL